MPNSTMFFVQNCPTCGRRVKIRVEYLARTLVCQHCGAQFIASDQDLSDDATTAKAEELLRRAEELLQKEATQTQLTSVAHPR